MNISRSCLWFVVGLMLAVVAVPSMAQTNPPQYGLWGANLNIPACAGASFLPTLQACVNRFPPATYSITNCQASQYGTSVESKNCTCTRSDIVDPNSTTCGLSRTYICVTGAFNPSTGNCDGGTPPVTCPAAGTKVGSGQVLYTGATITTICLNVNGSACSTDWRGGSAIGLAGGTAGWSIWGDYYATGNPCPVGQSGQTPTAASSTPSTPPAACQAGTCFGTVNGQSTCLPCSNSQVQTKASGTTSAPDGTTTSSNSTSTTTVNNTTNNVTTSTTTTTTTTAPGGQPVTKTTTTTDEKPIPKFCEENPNLPVCRDSSFGGTCGAFSCSGDAIQCAIARQAYQVQCDYDTSPEAAFYRQDNTLPSAAQASQSLNKSGSGDVNVESIFNANRTRLASPIGACPPPFSVNVFGAVVPISFQVLCDFAGIIKAFVMLLATLAALRYIMG